MTAEHQHTEGELYYSGPPWQRDSRLPPNLRFTEFWAWCVIDPADGDESVLSATTAFGVMPLVGADRTRVECWRAVAEGTARELGRPVHLYRFTTREVVDTINPPEDTPRHA